MAGCGKHEVRTIDLVRKRHHTSCHIQAAKKQPQAPGSGQRSVYGRGIDG